MQKKNEILATNDTNTIARPLAATKLQNANFKLQIAKVRISGERFFILHFLLCTLHFAIKTSKENKKLADSITNGKANFCYRPKSWDGTSIPKMTANFLKQRSNRQIFSFFYRGRGVGHPASLPRPIFCGRKTSE
jgi:hypothetical protein